MPSNVGSSVEFEPFEIYEYGIEHRRYPVPEHGPHRWGMAQKEAESFIADWENDGGVVGVFRVIRRPVGVWSALDEY